MIDYNTDQFVLSENRAPVLNGKRVGEKFQAIINYKAIEKTKSFTMLKIGHLSEITSKRIY